MQIPKDNIRNNILKAAENIFLEKGYSKTSMREIAAKSNVVLSNIYNYFKNKEFSSNFLYDSFLTCVYIRILKDKIWIV